MKPMPATPGLHHVSVLASDAARNVRFWTRTMGQRLIKRTVNYDAPTNHHLYYGDGEGRVGTALTFFPFPMAARGVVGTGETSAVAYNVRADALPYWRARLDEAGLDPTDADRWDRPVLTFRDPDGLKVDLVGLPDPPDAAGWDGEPVPAHARLRGFEGVTLRVAKVASTAGLLEAMGYRPVRERPEGGARRVRYETGTGALGDAVELVEEHRSLPGRSGRGTVHHVAFRVPDDATQAAARDALLAMGLHPTEVRERRYFRSIYVREPGGILFEFATDGPGMTVDEPVRELGRTLRLPPSVESRRAEIEAGLPPLDPTPTEVPE